MSVSQPSPAAKPLIVLIGLYRRVISPMLGARCRFYPSCSAYAQEALATHGLVHGAGLALRRISHCHPWNPGGLDYVPGRDAGAPAGNSSTNAVGAP